MACAVADWPTIGVSADARRKWPAADCDFSHYDLAVILLLFKIPEEEEVRIPTRSPMSALGRKAEIGRMVPNVRL